MTRRMLILLLAATAVLGLATTVAAMPADPDRPVSDGDGDTTTYGDCGAEMCAYSEAGNDTLAGCDDTCEYQNLDGSGDKNNTTAGDEPTFGECGGEVCAYDGTPDGEPCIECTGGPIDSHSGTDAGEVSEEAPGIGALFLLGVLALAGLTGSRRRA